MRVCCQELQRSAKAGVAVIHGQTGNCRRFAFSLPWRIVFIRILIVWATNVRLSSSGVNFANDRGTDCCQLEWHEGGCKRSRGLSQDRHSGRVHFVFARRNKVEDQPPEGFRVVERLEQRLAELVRLADRLARDARPARASRLEYLRLAGVDALWRMYPSPQLHDPALRRLADEVGDSPELVQHDLAEFFRLDLTDYSEEYAADRRFYESHKQLGEAAVEFLGEMFPTPEVMYVLHRVLCSWHPERLQGSAGIIIEGTDYDEEDYRFCRAIDGYLVSRGLAFESDVEVLAASFYDGWPAWDEFWDRYYGWSEHWGGPD